MPRPQTREAKAVATYAGALAGVDVAYTATAEGVKEDVVLSGPSSPTSFDFTVVPSPGLVATEAGGGIDFVDTEGTTQASFAAPFAYDAAFEDSGAEESFTEEAVTLRIVERSPELVVRLAADPAWLSAPERAWPVVIDPVLTIGGSDADTYLNKSFPDSNYNTGSRLFISGGTSVRRAIQAKNIAAFFDEPATLFSATFQLYATSDTSSLPAAPVGLHEMATREWNSAAATWNTRLNPGLRWARPGGDFVAQPAFVNPKVTGAPGWRSWPMTELAQKWLDGTPHSGVMIKYENEAAGALVGFASTNEADTNLAPRIVVNWEPLEGVRAPYSYEELDLGAAGQASVNVASGNLTLAHRDLDLPGTGLATTVDRFYQSRGVYSASVGARWRMWPQSEERLYYASGYVGDYAHNGDVMLRGSPEEVLVFSQDDTGSYTEANPNGTYTSPPGYRPTLRLTSEAGAPVFKLTDPDSGIVRSFYGSGYQRDITDPSGNKISFGYTCDLAADECYMVSMTDTQGRVTRFQRSAAGPAGQYKVTTVTEPTGRVHRYAYDRADAKANLASYTDPAGAITSYQYSGTVLGQLSRVTDPSGAQTRFAYDAKDRLVSLTRVSDPATGAGPTWRFDYSVPWQTKVTDANGGVTTYRFDRQGKVTSSEGPPFAPTDLAAVPGNGRASLSWEAAAPNGSPITAYTLVASPGGATTTVAGGSTSAMFEGLTNDTPYTFTVRATNALGTSAPSAPSNSVTPSAPPPTVTSSSHPDQSRAYDDNDPILAWARDEPSGIVGWSYVLDREEATAPDRTSEGTGTTRSYTDLSDGTWWFHIASLDGAGNPSPVAHYRITIETTTIPAPVVSSPTHPDPEGWYAETTPALDWTNADPPGAVAHSFELDQDPATTPDEVPEGEAALARFPATSEGQWWFHVRSQIANGRWGDTAHRRVGIDTTAPTAPGAPMSTSHLRGVSSPDRSVDMTWAPATDEVAGVSGYRWSFTTSETPPASPDDEATATGTSVRSDELADGVWFFHARAVDAAGNLGPYTSFGPIAIDGAAGLILPRLGLDPVASSDGVGLEQFFPLDDHDVGGATAYANLDNGNLVVVDEDADIAAQGINVGVRHVYNSQRGDTDDGLGRGWNLSVGDFSAGLEGLTGAVGDLDLTRPLALADLGEIVDGVYQVLGQVLELSDADGTTHRFVRRGGPGGRWESPAGVDLRVVEQRNLLGLVSAYDLVRPDGVTYRAENISLVAGIDLPSPTWRLTQVSDRNGNQLAYTYRHVGLTRAVRLSEVTHNRRPGVMVRLDYDDNANVDTIVTLPGLEAPDPATGQVRSWARTIDVDVVAAPGLGGLVGNYRLAEVVENAHLAEGDPARRATSYAYDDEGVLAAVIDPRRSEPTELRYEPGADEAPRLRFMNDRRGQDWEWRYGPAAEDGSHETTAVSPLGVATTYAVSGRAPVSPDDRRIVGGNVVSITDPGTDAGPVTTRYGWSANRMTASTDGAGATTRMRYNDLGLLSEVVAPSPNAADAPTGEGVHQGEVRNTLRYRFLSPGGAYDACDPTSAPANPDISSEGYCDTVGELVRVAMAADVADQARISDFGYDDAGNLTAAIQRGDPSAAPGAPAGPTDRATTTAYHPASGGLMSSIDGPRSDVADVTAYGEAGAPGFGYHASGQPTTITDAAAKTKALAYTPYGLTGAEVDRDGHRRTSSYDEADNLLASTDPEGQRTSFAYDANDNRISSTSPRGNATPGEGDFTTTWSYDANDWMTETSSPGADGGPRTRTTTAYAPDGKPMATTSARGATTTYAYWPNRSLRATDAPADGEARAITESFYDAAGRVARTLAPVANAEGQRPETVVSYSPSGAVATVAQTSSGPEARLSRYAYDAHGQQVLAEGPNSLDGVAAMVTQDHDAFGQVTRLRRRLGAERWLETTTAYDAAGNTTSVAQPSGEGAQLTSTFAFDALDRLTSSTDPQNPGHSVDYAYDGEGAQTQRSDKVNGAVVRRSATTHNPDDTLASVVATDVDPASGAPTSTIATCNFAPGAEATSGYDADGHLLETRTLTTEGAGGCDTGTLARAQSFAYDERGAMVGSTQEVRSPETGAMVARTQAFAHDPDGARASATQSVPGGASYTTTYAHNDAGAPTTVTDWRGKVSTTAYLPSGAPSSATLGSGVASASLGWHADGMPESLVWRNGADQVLRSHDAIAYDQGARRIAEDVAALQPDGTTTAGAAAYGYDLADRLIDWTSPFADPLAGEALSVSYDLDDGANVTGATTTGATTGTELAAVVADYPNGRLASRTTTAGGTSASESFSYDGLGQEILRQGEGVELATGYDPMGHTTAVDDRTGSDDDVDSVFDGADRLVSRTEAGAGPERAETTLYFYWGMGAALAEEADGAGRTLVRYLPDAGGGALAQQSYRIADGHADATDAEGTWRWLLSDADANVATHLSDDGTVAEQVAFDPYGKPEGPGSSVTDPKQRGSTLGFQGAITDKVTGSVVLGPRLYDPSTARFTSADSFVAGGLDLALASDPLTGNRYLFAGANPVAFFDDGHAPREQLYRGGRPYPRPPPPGERLERRSCDGGACGGPANKSAPGQADCPVGTNPNGTCRSISRGAARNAGGGIRGVGRGTRWLFHHTEIGASVCVIRCVGIGTQGGTIYRQTGWGCCFAGANVGIARRKYAQRACNTFGGTGSAGPVGVYGEMGIYGNPRERGGLAPSADFAGGWSGGIGAGLAGMTNRDLLGQRSC